MPALTKNRQTEEWSLGGKTNVDPVAAAAHIFKGALAALNNSGDTVPAAAASTRVRGVAMAEVDNTSGAAGDLNVETRKGTFKFHQTGLTRADIGTDVNVTDDQTVGGAGPCVAGELVQLDGAFAWVKIK